MVTVYLNVFSHDGNIHHIILNKGLSESFKTRILSVVQKGKTEKLFKEHPKNVVGIVQTPIVKFGGISFSTRALIKDQAKAPYIKVLTTKFTDQTFEFIDVQSDLISLDEISVLAPVKKAPKTTKTTKNTKSTLKKKSSKLTDDEEDIEIPKEKNPPSKKSKSVISLTDDDEPPTPPKRARTRMNDSLPPPSPFVIENENTTRSEPIGDSGESSTPTLSPEIAGYITSAIDKYFSEKIPDIVSTIIKTVREELSRTTTERSAFIPSNPISQVFHDELKKKSEVDTYPSDTESKSQSIPNKPYDFMEATNDTLAGLFKDALKTSSSSSS